MRELVFNGMKMKKIGSIVLALAMVLALMPVSNMTVYADSATEHSNAASFVYTSETESMWVTSSLLANVQFNNGDLLVSTSEINVKPTNGSSFTVVKPDDTTEVVNDHLNGVNISLNSSKKYSVSWSGATVTVAEYSSSKTVSKATTTNGSFTLSATGYTADATNGSLSVPKDIVVTITPTPEIDYDVVGVKVKDENDSRVTVTNNNDGTYKFTMPSKNVNVIVAFAKVYNWSEAPTSIKNKVLGKYVYGPLTTIFSNDGVITEMSGEQY